MRPWRPALVSDVTEKTSRPESFAMNSVSSPVQNTCSVSLIAPA